MASKLVISFDFELGWGVLDSDVWRIREREGLYARLRPILYDLISFLKSANMPTTWAIVSSLTVEKKSDLIIDHLPQSYQAKASAFIKEASWETRCATDIFDKMQRVFDFTEVCSHSATHIYSSFPNVSAAQFVGDVALSFNMLEKNLGQSVSSIIFPRDQLKFSHLVAKLRPLNIRLNPLYYKKYSWWNRFLPARFLSSRIPESRVTVGNHDSIYQSGSLFFNWPLGHLEKLKEKLLVQRQKRLCEALSTNDLLYHVWLHPFNLAQSKKHRDYFMNFLVTVDRLRDKGIVELATMRDIGKNIQQIWHF